MHFQPVNNSEGVQAAFPSVSTPRARLVKEPRVITQHQNKSLTPMAGSGDGERMILGWGGSLRARDWRIHGIQEGYTLWSEVSQHCCKSSAGPCKLSDKLRLLKD